MNVPATQTPTVPPAAAGVRTLGALARIGRGTISPASPASPASPPPSALAAPVAAAAPIAPVETLYFLTQLRRPLHTRPFLAPGARPVGGLLADLAALDVEIWAEDGRLRYSAPQGALTPELRAEIGRRRGEILAVLANAARPAPAASAVSAASAPLRAIPRGGEIPLSFAQERLWFLARLEPENPFYSMPAAFRLTGALAAAALAASLAEIVRRHEVLRTVYPEPGDGSGRAVAVILPAAPVPLPRVDLGRLPADRRETALRQATATLAARPFDLARGPVLAAALISPAAPGETVLFLAFHHIAFDGGSVRPLFAELSALYRAFGAGRPSPLAPPTLQFADYAAWQRRWRTEEALAASLAAWKRRLAPPLAALELPTDRPRPAVQRFRGATCRARVLSAAHRERLETFGRFAGATPYMTLAAAFAALLHRTSGQTDILLGTDVDTRDRAELTGMLGFFVNQLVLRADVGGDPPFRQLLSQVRDVALEGYAHRDLPFERLVAELQPERDLSRNPLFQVSFTLDSGTPAVPELAGLAVSPLGLATGRAQFDLALSLAASPQGIEARLEYDTDLFDPPTARRLLAYLETLLAGLATTPDRPISELPFLGEGERQQVLVEWTGGAGGGEDLGNTDPAGAGGIERLLRWASLTPRAVAVAAEDGVVSYGELGRRALRLARQLAAMGVGPEVPVAILAERGAGWVSGVLGVLAAGGVYLPLDPRHPPARRRAILLESGVSWVLAAEALAAELAGSEARVLILEELLAPTSGPATGDPRPPGDPLGLAYVIYTSGSTGAPKGAMVTLQGMVNHLRVKIADLALTAADGVAQTASQAFDISVWQVLAPLWVGGRVEVFGDSVVRDPALLLAQLAAARVTVLEIVPSLLGALLDRLEEDPAGAGAVERLRWLVVTGEALPPDLCRRLARRFPDLPVLNAYGPTECSDDVTHHRLLRAPAAGMVHVPIGRPIENARLFVLDPELRPLPIGAPGELCVGGPVVGRGYLRDPERTARAFTPAPGPGARGGRLYRTGDLARFLADGTLEFLGRLDQQVKVRGFRIELEEVEVALRRHPAVRQAVVVARAVGSSADRRLLAYVVWKDEAGPRADAAELRQFLAESLPEAAIPAAFLPLPRLPLSVNGKIDRAALPELRELPGPELAPGSYAPPENAAEAALAEIWARVLRVPRVGRHDNFFALGGDSILSLQIAAQAARAGLAITPRSLFLHRTVAELASAAGPPRRPTLTGEGSPALLGPAPLTPIQKGFFARELPDPAHWNQALLLAVRGAVPARLDRALARLQEHHPALALRFFADAGEWKQRVATPLVLEPLRVADLSALPAARRPEAVEALSAAAQASLDLTTGPLLRAVFFHLGNGGEDRLLLAVHHLVVDGVSWRILLEDLAALAFAPGEVPLPPPTTPFIRWAAELAALARSGALAGDLASWSSRSWERALALPLDHPEAAAADGEGNAATVRAALPAESTRALLRDLPPVYGTEIDDALLTALAQAFFAWTGGPLLVELEGHGREELVADADLSRTVGWFTALFPVLLELPATGGPGAALKAVKEELRRIPHRGATFGVLRETTPALREIPSPEVLFNYLGQLDSVLGDGGPLAFAPESAGPPKSPRGRRGHRLEINAYVLAGQLETEWIYGARVFEPATVEALAAGFLAAIEALIAHGRSSDASGYTPSDFSLLDLAQGELDALVAELTLDTEDFADEVEP